MKKNVDTIMLTKPYSAADVMFLHHMRCALVPVKVRFGLSKT
jgi:hypothetical protein